MISRESDRGDFKLSEQDVYLFVLAKSSNAISLVAAFDTTRDEEYLRAAVARYPKNPLVQAKALVSLEMSEEQRAKMTEDFKKSAPTNALANFLAAREAMKRGDTTAALAELAAARGKLMTNIFATGYKDWKRRTHRPAGRRLKQRFWPCPTFQSITCPSSKGWESN